MMEEERSERGTNWLSSEDARDSSDIQRMITSSDWFVMEDKEQVSRFEIYPAMIGED
jgi:hypothetical protein